MGKRETITTKVYEVLSEYSIESDITKYQENFLLKENLGFDSLSTVNLILSLNEAFDIQIHSTDITPENFLTLKSLIDFIMKKI